MVMTGQALLTKKLCKDAHLEQCCTSISHVFYNNNAKMLCPLNCTTSLYI